MILCDLSQPEFYLTLTPAVAWLALAWFFVIGACLGSFLNVVVYRLPRSMSLVHPGSRCPTCEHPIRWHDNIPILGWLLLGGKCRDCHAPIARRYPRVELAVALASVAIGWSQAMTSVDSLDAGAGPSYAVSLQPYAFMMLLTCTLWAAALMRFDRMTPPLALFACVLVAGLAWGALWPHARGSFAVDDASGLLTGVHGFGAAMLMAMLAWPAWFVGPAKDRLSRAIENTAAILLVGVFLGAAWGSLVVAASLAMAFLLAIASGRWLQVGRISVLYPLAGFTLAVVVFVPVLDLTNGLAAHELQTVWIAGATISLLALAIRAICSRVSSAAA